MFSVASPEQQGVMAFMCCRSLEQNLASVLETGECVEEVVAPVFPFNPQLAEGGLTNWFVTRTWAIFATNCRIILARVGEGHDVSLKDIVGSVPRSTGLGDPCGVFWMCDRLGEPVWITDKQFSQVQRINIAA
jgi:hypothetical protein